MVVIEKPLVDDRQYKLITLPNGLEVLLVQDPQTDKAAAALDVNVGAYYDPPKIPGLAHFLEHLLFMGTKKYPSENEYSQYLSDHSGTYNAYTAAERTNFYFEVGHQYLSGALDRFAQFFISPLFSESCTSREMNAVDSENKKNLQNDVWRLSQLEKELSNPNHPVHKFSTGNLETLGAIPKSQGIDTRQELLKFYAEYYTASLMKLVVIGREDVEQLEQMVSPLFSEVPDPHPELSKKPKFYDHIDPLTPDNLGKLIKAQTVMDMKMLEVAFPVPNQQPLWDTQPFHYFVHLLGHESEGSLFYYLKEKKWATELGCAITHISDKTDYLLVNIDLSNEGLDHWQDVLAALFAYIDMVRSQKIQKWIFDEIKSVSLARFLYREKGKAFQLSSSLAQTLQRPIPREQILKYSVATTFDEEATAEFGTHLNRDNIRVILASQSIQGDKVEKWYGTRYSVDDVPSLPEFKDVHSLHLPHKNDFIPDNFDLCHVEAPCKQSRPRLIINEQNLKLWHKLDDTFLVPKALYTVKMVYPDVSQSARHCAVAAMFTSMVHDELSDYSYYADVAEVSYSFNVRPTGFEIKVQGFNEKLCKLLEVVVDKIATEKLKKDRFDVVKEQEVRSMRNMLYTEPYVQCNLHVLPLMASGSYGIVERLAEMETLTFEEVNEFALELRNKGTRLEFLGTGNCSTSYLERVARDTASKLSKTDSPQMIRPRSYIYESGDFNKKFLLSDENNSNSFLQVCFQFGDVLKGDSEDIRLNTILHVIAQILKEPTFDQLRTKEQLGYIAASFKRVFRSTMWFVILVQSEETTDYLDQRIESFIQKVAKQIITDLSEEELQIQIESVIARCTEKYRNVEDENDSYWGSISSGYYDFYKRQEIAEMARTIKKEEIVSTFHKHIIEPTRTRVGLHFIPKASPKLNQEMILAKVVARLVLERGLDIPSTVVEAFMVECKGLTAEQALMRLVERLIEHTPLDVTEATAFAQECATRCQSALSESQDKVEESNKTIGKELSDNELDMIRSFTEAAKPVVSITSLQEYEFDHNSELDNNSPSTNLHQLSSNSKTPTHRLDPKVSLVLWIVLLLIILQF